MDKEHILSYDLANPNQPDNTFYQLTIIQGKENKDRVFAHPLVVGLKVKVRENILELLKETIYIQKNFKLNIKRLNRWWYSVYFDEKK